jgi:hypothetical protein
MGMVHCEKHDLSFIWPCCIHIHAAVRSGAREDAFLAADGWGHHHPLCRQCYAKALEILDRNRDNDEGFGFDLGDGLNWAECETCLEEWLAATGQGHLSNR